MKPYSHKAHLRNSDPLGYSWEHVIPWRRGGRNVRNLVLAHGCCNLAKGDKRPTPQMLADCKALYDSGLITVNLGSQIQKPEDPA